MGLQLAVYDDPQSPSRGCISKSQGGALVSHKGVQFENVRETKCKLAGIIRRYESMSCKYRLVSADLYYKVRCYDLKHLGKV